MNDSNYLSYEGIPSEKIDELHANLNKISGDDMKRAFEESQRTKALKEEEKKLNNSGFVWDEKEMIKNKVFPIDLNENILFYGLLIPKIVDNTDGKGRILGKKQKLIPCLITDGCKLKEVNERLKEDMKIDFESIPSFLPQRWELNKIKEFLQGSTSNIDGLNLLNRIKSQYEKYVFIRNKTWYSVNSLWDIGTYLYTIFEAYPLFEKRGLAGTGKSKDMSVSSLMSFNGGQIMVNPSEATLFRETDEVRGTKYIDEAEKLWVFNKATKQYEGDVRTELINASYTKLAKVPRQEKIGNKFVTKWYSPYSPTQLSSINGLYGATETRAITRITTKSPDGDNRGEKEPLEDRHEPIWAEIRDECYRFALINWKGIKAIYNNFPDDSGLKRRDLQIWKPILSIAKYLDNSVYNDVLNLAKDQSSRRLDDLVPESSFDYMCLDALKNAIEQKKGDKIPIEEIKICYCNLSGNISGLNDIYLNRNISNHLDKLGFKEFRGRDKNSSYFAISQDIFNEIVAPICPNLVILSTPSTPSTPLHINKNNYDVDRVVIDVDKENKKVVMVAIDGDNVDDTNMKPIKKCSKCQKNDSLIVLENEQGFCEECYND